MNLIGPGNRTSIRLGMKTRQRIRIDGIPDYAQLGRASELAELVDNLPPLPQVLVRGLELLDQPDISTARLTALLGEDPALAARVLSTANSPVFSRGTSVTTLEKAVAVLGLAQLKPVLVTACLDTLRQETTLAVLPAARVLREEAWQNSVCTALAAARIARELAFPYAEEAYLHGLLHDLGKLALIHVLPAQYVEAYANREPIFWASRGRGGQPRGRAPPPRCSRRAQVALSHRHLRGHPTPPRAGRLTPEGFHRRKSDPGATGGPHRPLPRLRVQAQRARVAREDPRLRRPPRAGP